MAEEIKTAEEPKAPLAELSVDIQDAFIDPTVKGKLQLLEEGRVYKTHLTANFINRKVWKTPNPLEVLSHIPGSVVDIFVKKNERVKKGEKLMSYEAMKMKNVVTAPMDGEIREINVKAGDHLPKGAVLLTFKKPIVKDKKRK